MAKIHRNKFLRDFKHGMDAEKLQKAVEGTEISPAEVRRLDANRDGVIKGRELVSAFRAADRFDRDGSGRSFELAGQSEKVYEAFVKAKSSGPYHGTAIAEAARDRARRFRDEYAFNNAPPSPHPRLSGNRRPDESTIRWLKNKNKCNQFVGDALTQAGVRAPTVKQPDGSVHYAYAEKWPRYNHLFNRITDPKELKVGDVIVNDYPSEGGSTAHTEIVTGVDPLRTTGAHHGGAWEKDWSDLLRGAAFNAEGQHFEKHGNKVYLLRPTRRL